MRKKLALLLVFMGLVSMINLIYLMQSSFSRFMPARQLNPKDEPVEARQRGLKEPVWSEANSGRNQQDEGKALAKPSLSDKDILQKMEQLTLILDKQNFSRENGKVLEPSQEYERIRRRLRDGVEENGNFIRSQVKQIEKYIEDKSIVAKIDEVLELSGERQRYIMADIYNMGQVDGHAPWRQRELMELSNLVQQRLLYLQNPKDCRNTRKVLCNFKIECGFGCQVHHVAFCMMMAYGTGRTLILHSNGWAYAKEGWEQLLQPLSQTCRNDSGNNKAMWGDPSTNEEVQVLELPIIGKIPQSDRPDFLPLAIPEDISEKLMKLHGFPAVWWIGQIVKYVLRPQPDIKDYIERKAAALGFIHPIVGIHIRRTDKILEAQFHGIEEYMVHVEEFYQRLERRQDVPVRRIYLATDEASILEEARKRYPSYVFVSDNAISKTAALSSRYTENSLKGILTDVYLLARSDYFVCTFTSNIGRLVYELRQDHHEDASATALSLDYEYYFHGDKGHQLVAIHEHKPRGSNEIELSPGDIIDFDFMRNRRAGYARGRNRRLNPSRYNLFPAYKAERKIKVVKMPSYSAAKNFHL